MTSSAAEQHPSGKRLFTRVEVLSDLVGAHPHVLETIFRAGRAADPAELGAAPRGRLLAIAPGSELFLAARSVVRALSGDHFPWRGKVFDHGGNSGQNVVFGQRLFRFRAEVLPSAIDGGPALALHYGGAHGNPWPVRVLRDELRTVGQGVAIGPALLSGRVILWFGLERERA